MEGYPSYRCPNCGGHTNMLATGHVKPAGQSGYQCERAPTKGLLPPLHYDLGPELSVDWDAHKQRWVERTREDGRIVEVPISELEAFALAVKTFPDLLTPARERLRAKLAAEPPQSLIPGSRRRQSALAEAP